MPHRPLRRGAGGWGGRHPVDSSSKWRTIGALRADPDRTAMTNPKRSRAALRTPRRAGDALPHPALLPRPLAAAVQAAAPVILGESAAIRALRRDLARIAQSAASTVLLLGESGTGKELIARAIHDASERAAGRFVVVNCSAVPATLLEEEFFGHEPGAFTDARSAKRGLLEVADGGTLFLDEVGELEPVLQAKFLRFLEERTYRRLGGTDDLPVDVRFLAATNVDLDEHVRRGRFRRDLYYRLQVVTLRVPPLRERMEDVPLLARHFLEHYAARFHKAFAGFSGQALARLAAHPWPGNVRELRNAIERVVLLSDGPLVDDESLLLTPPSQTARSEPPPLPEDDLDLERLELRALVRALERTGGNLSQASRLLGVSRDTVRHRMRKHRVRVETRIHVDSAAEGPTAPRGPVPSSPTATGA